MLKRFTKVYLNEQTNKILRAYISTETNEKWDLLTSVCLERKPVITSSLNSIETDFQKYLMQIELERSLKSDHEMRNENDRIKAELLKKGESSNLQLDTTQLQTAQDFKDACIEELTKFQFASRTTEADRKDDKTSLERSLDRHLVLVTNQPIGKQKFYLPPQGIRQDGESLKQTAERILKETCGNEIKAKFYGNAPSGFYKYKYPKEVQKNGVVGAKVFIYFARYLDGQIKNKSEYKWLDRTELSNEVPTDYNESLSKFLIDENYTETKIST